MHFYFALLAFASSQIVRSVVTSYISGERSKIWDIDYQQPMLVHRDYKIYNRRVSLARVWKRASLADDVIRLSTINYTVQ